MRKTILLLASAASAIIILSSCSEALKDALMENCHLYTTVNSSKIPLCCESVPVTTCSEFAEKFPKAEFDETSLDKPCPNDTSTPSCTGSK